MENIEQKFKIKDLDTFARIKTILTSECGEPVALEQTDVYCASNPGYRVKLRTETNNGMQTTNLIVYKRADVATARESHYVILEPRTGSNDAGVIDIIIGALVPEVWVIKQRLLFTWHRTVRVHLDNVKGLGYFIEFEDVLDNSDASRVQIAHENLNALRLKLNLTPGNSSVISIGYKELMQEAYISGSTRYTHDSVQIVDESAFLDEKK